jgi:hypothetical protein
LAIGNATGIEGRNWHFCWEIGEFRGNAGFWTELPKSTEFLTAIEQGENGELHTANTICAAGNGAPNERELSDKSEPFQLAGISTLQLKNSSA